MQETIRKFCWQYRVFFDQEPLLLSHSPGTWLIRDVSGKSWVCKVKTADDNSIEILKNLEVLHPPFLFPQPVSEEKDAFLLYPYIEGQLLSEGPFEEPDVIELVMEAMGRMQATMRSLVLVPFYKESLRVKGEGDDLIDELSKTRDLGRLQMFDDRHKAMRQKEIAQSYQWTQKEAQSAVEKLKAANYGKQSVYDTLLKTLDNYFPLHVAITGTNLCHCSCQPEHLLWMPDRTVAILSWKIEPRPRFYMQHTYLTWSLIHSRKPDAIDFYRSHLVARASKAFTKEHYLVFAFCLIRQLAQLFNGSASLMKDISGTHQTDMWGLIEECVKNVG